MRRNALSFLIALVFLSGTILFLALNREYNNGRSTVYYNSESINKRSLDRLYHIRKSCHKTKTVPKELDWQAFENNRLDNVTIDVWWWQSKLVCPQFKLVYSVPAKAGTTNLKHYILQLTGELANLLTAEKINADYDHDERMQLHYATSRLKTLKPLAAFTTAEAKEIMATYRKVMFMRHPIDRLLSAFHERIEWPDRRVGNPQIRVNSYGQTALAIAQQSRGKVMNQDNFYPISFNELLSFLDRSPNHRLIKKDKHFAPQVVSLLPCAIGYDFVGAMETFQEDVEHLARQLTGLNVVPRVAQPPKLDESAKERQQALQSVNVTLLRQVMLKIYRDDFDILGYEIK